MAAECLQNGLENSRWHSKEVLPSPSLVLLIDSTLDSKIYTRSLTEQAENKFTVIPVTIAENGKLEKAIDDFRPRLILLNPESTKIDPYDLMNYLTKNTGTPLVILDPYMGHFEQRHTKLMLAGIEDVLPRDENPQVAAAKIISILRRLNEKEIRQPVIKIRNLTIDLERNIVKKKSSLVHFSPTEWNLLKLLAENPGTPLTNNQILGIVWGAEYVDDIDALESLRVIIQRVRKKIGYRKKPIIETIFETGYRFVIEDTKDQEPKIAA